jgi:hypothetical protein
MAAALFGFFDDLNPQLQRQILAFWSIELVAKFVCVSAPQRIYVEPRSAAIDSTSALSRSLFLVSFAKTSSCRKSALFLRAITPGLSATIAFSLFEVWPRRLPRGYERWILQVAAVGAAMPLTLFAMHRRATSPGAPPFFEDHDWMLVGASALLVAPWAAVATVVRQKEAFARNQKLMFALERSELERTRAATMC